LLMTCQRAGALPWPWLKRGASVSELLLWNLGAKGETAKAMARTLQLPGTTSLTGLKARTQALDSLDGPGVTLDQSNQIRADPSLPTNQSYLNALATEQGRDVDLAQAVHDVPGSEGSGDGELAGTVHHRSPVGELFQGLQVVVREAGVWTPPCRHSSGVPSCSAPMILYQPARPARRCNSCGHPLLLEQDLAQADGPASQVAAVRRVRHRCHLADRPHYRDKSGSVFTQEAVCP
jgi:hypothetical protein